MTDGYLFRPLARGGHLARTSEPGGPVITHPGPLSEAMLWEMVREYGRRIEQDQLAPHDLRRTTAKLCRANGRELEQIQLLLGHASVQTTERYLGTKQNLADAPNDQLGLVPED
jgi:integrase